MVVVADTTPLHYLVLIEHESAFDYQALVARFRLIVDTRNALKGVQEGHVFRL